MKLQPVRGTRDFYPEATAFRNWLFETWRRVSRRAGFQEVDGPVLEPLDLYTEKSGPEIAEQLYWLQDKGGRRLALRPEFTPTLARMIVARQAALPVPIRWFNISRCFRYERAQKGRLREFFQWNVDLVGVAEATADAECIAVAVEALEEMGLGPEDVVVRISDRRLLGAVVRRLGVPEAQVPAVFAALDKRDKVPPDALAEMLAGAGLSAEHRAALERVLAWEDLADIGPAERADPAVAEAADALGRLFDLLEAYGIAEWCRFDIGIVRGLAYYTGPVWEVHDRRGELRAVFGGGRYDRLLESMGGRPMPACGFGCGDAVLGLLLEARGRVPSPEPPAEYYVAAVPGTAVGDVLRTVRRLRRSGRSALYDPAGGSLRRQMKRANDLGVPFVVIVSEALGREGVVTLRNMATGRQEDVPLDRLVG